MGRVSKAAAAVKENPKIEELVSGLEQQIRRLSEVANAGREQVSEGADEVNEFVARALEDIMNRVRNTSADVGSTVASEISRIGSDTAKKVADEVEHRPLIMLALAAGIGFLIGFANRR